MNTLRQSHNPSKIAIAPTKARSSSTAITLISSLKNTERGPDLAYPKQIIQMIHNS